MQNLNIFQILKQPKVHRPLYFNSVLWILAFIILIFIFSKGTTPITVDYIYTICLLLVIAIPVNLNFYVLIPKLLNRERYGVYIFSVVMVFVIFSLLSCWLLQPVLHIFFNEYFFISYLKPKDVFLVFGVFLAGSTLLKLAEEWIYFNRTQNQILRLENQHIQTQLTALRSQINPHFLFNSINVIYAMALQKKETITTAIIELSDILRYVIYDSNTERVTLSKEIQLLENYIAFQKHRNLPSQHTTLEVDVENVAFQIYPLLLLPLVENAFKYVDNSEEHTNVISIRLTQNKDDFFFSIENRKQKENLNLDESSSGVGLKTLKENLELVYPNQHELSISDGEIHFKVELKINNA